MTTARITRDRRRPNDMDRHAWALEQATMLERGRHEGLDTLLLAEEMTELGRSEYSALLSALTRLLQHLLKWDHQPRRRGRSWVNTIDEQWERVRDRLDDSPSLRGQLDVILAKAYSKGRAAMLRETLLTSDMIPEICPYAWDDIMTREIVWPED